ncbi:hypothetical protein CXG81DRAFT_20613 [Caulochytrium protostelioides]|uniref:Uncharacterized protein n=1 Tax=Caulochytrium protostelioides TaxID=1555241 RepID=A0A4P9X096_9FUNG|nr:hypothetical protein CXG81DRAFT_20613 [Caulochytrium protostelioides]|eukprot:RKO99289.1 hypothetical protein CXG81DRAFT_20613 [Caulochytrium protostelioides]
MLRLPARHRALARLVWALWFLAHAGHGLHGGLLATATTTAAATTETFDAADAAEASSALPVPVTVSDVSAVPAADSRPRWRLTPAGPQAVEDRATAAAYNDLLLDLLTDPLVQWHLAQLANHGGPDSPASSSSSSSSSSPWTPPQSAALQAAVHDPGITRAMAHALARYTQQTADAGLTATMLLVEPSVHATHVARLKAALAAAVGLHVGRWLADDPAFGPASPLTAAHRAAAQPLFAALAEALVSRTTVRFRNTGDGEPPVSLGVLGRLAGHWEADTPAPPAAVVPGPASSSRRLARRDTAPLSSSPVSSSSAASAYASVFAPASPLASLSSSVSLRLSPAETVDVITQQADRDLRALHKKVRSMFETVRGTFKMSEMPVRYTHSVGIKPTVLPETDLSPHFFSSEQQVLFERGHLMMRENREHALAAWRGTQTAGLTKGPATLLGTPKPPQTTAQKLPQAPPQKLKRDKPFFWVNEEGQRVPMTWQRVEVVEIPGPEGTAPEKVILRQGKAGYEVLRDDMKFHPCQIPVESGQSLQQAVAAMKDDLLKPSGKAFAATFEPILESQQGHLRPTVSFNRLWQVVSGDLAVWGPGVKDPAALPATLLSNNAERQAVQNLMSWSSWLHRHPEYMADYEGLLPTPLYDEFQRIVEIFKNTNEYEHVVTAFREVADLRYNRLPELTQVLAKSKLAFDGILTAPWFDPRFAPLQSGAPSMPSTAQALFHEYIETIEVLMKQLPPGEFANMLKGNEVPDSLRLGAEPTVANPLVGELSYEQIAYRAERCRELERWLKNIVPSEQQFTAIPIERLLDKSAAARRTLHRFFTTMKELCERDIGAVAQMQAITETHVFSKLPAWCPENIDQVISADLASQSQDAWYHHPIYKTLKAQKLQPIDHAPIPAAEIFLEYRSGFWYELTQTVEGRASFLRAVGATFALGISVTLLIIVLLAIRRRLRENEAPKRRRKQHPALDYNPIY